MTGNQGMHGYGGGKGIRRGRNRGLGMGGQRRRGFGVSNDGVEDSSDSEKKYHRGEGRRFRRGLERQLRRAQINELTEYEVYKKLAETVENDKNKIVLRRIADEEAKHAKFWQKYTQEELKPKPFKIFFHTLISKLFGFSFAVKFMEKGEELAQINYDEISEEIPEAAEIEEEERRHENTLISLIDEASLKYMGSMVLGVNDALVELTGALSGLTFALQNTNLIAFTGLITGIAAAFSMGGSEYLSTKTEAQDKNPLKAALYTGSMYLVTVIFLILPYFLFSQIFLSLITMLLVAILIILAFTFYVSVTQDINFIKRFIEMAGISLGVSALSFGIGVLIRVYFGIEL